MIITNIITDKGTFRGVMLKDGDFSYPVCKEALLSKEIFLELVKNSSYKYYGNFSFSHPDGTPIAELPAIEYDSLDNSAKEEFDIPGTRMSDAELNSYKSKEIPPDAPKWREPIQVIINTREELIEYAKEPAKAFDPEDITTYLPLNAFTNPKALFTPEEFIQSANQKIISNLFDKEDKSLAAFAKMMSVISDKPITNTYEFLDAYYSFGFIGLNSGIYSISNTHRNTFFNNNPIKEVTYTFKNRMGNCYPELDRSFNFVDSEDNQYARLSALTDLQGLMLFKAEKPSFTEIKSYQLEGCTMERSMYKLRLSIKGAQLTLRIPSIVMPNYYNLPYEMYGFDSPEVKDNIVRWTQAIALEQHVSAITEDKTNVSSFKVCRYTSMSPSAAVYNILKEYKENVLPGILKAENRTSVLDGAAKSREERAMAMGLNGWDDYFTTDIESANNKDLYEVVDDIVSGSLNVGHLASAGSSKFKAIGSYFHLFYNMMLQLHIPFDNIARTLLNINHEDKVINLKFESPDLGVYVPLHLEKQMVKSGAFNKDLYSYNAKLAKESYYWSIITSVYSEPTEEARHVAAKMLVWDHHAAKRKTSFEGSVENYIISQLTDYYMPDEEHLYKDVANVIYKCAVGDYETEGDKCVIKLSTTATDKSSARGSQKPINIEIVLDKNLVSNITKNLKLRFEGTAILSENSTTHGVPYIYFINCMVSPYWVIPKKINVKPLYCEPISIAWACGNDLNVETYIKAKQLNILSSEEDVPSLYGSLFSAGSSVRMEKFLDEGTKRTIIDYCHDIVAKDKTTGNLTYGTVPVHPYDVTYPMYNVESSVPVNEKDTKKRPYSAVYEVTKAAVLARDKSGDIFDLLYTQPIAKGSNQVQEFKGYMLPELEMLTSNKLYEELTAPMTGIAASKLDNLGVTFQDGVTVPYENLPEYEGKYAVHAVTGNVILVKVNSRIYRVTI